MEKIDDERFRQLRKVRMVVREDWGWTPTGWTPRIAYRLRDGSEIVEQPERSRGQPPDLLAFDACVPKYRGCVEGLVPQQDIARSIEMLRSLEVSADIGELMRTVGH